jgi:hypothetical protein
MRHSTFEGRATGRGTVREDGGGKHTEHAEKKQHQARREGHTDDESVDNNRSHEGLLYSWKQHPKQHPKIKSDWKKRRPPSRAPSAHPKGLNVCQVANEEGYKAIHEKLGGVEGVLKKDITCDGKD